MGSKNTSLVTALETLSPKKQLAFALLIFERMLPSMTAFSRNTGFDGSCYLQARHAAWKALQNHTVDPALDQAAFKARRTPKCSLTN